MTPFSVAIILALSSLGVAVFLLLFIGIMRAVEHLHQWPAIGTTSNGSLPQEEVPNERQSRPAPRSVWHEADLSEAFVIVETSELRSGASGASQPIKDEPIAQAEAFLEAVREDLPLDFWLDSPDVNPDQVVDSFELSAELVSVLQEADSATEFELV